MTMMLSSTPTRPMPHYSRHQGFTLIELMIAVTIVALLAAVAIPSFTEYTSKSRRSEARALLMQISGKQEQFFLNNRTYSNDFTELGDLTASVIADDSVTSENNYYVVTIAIPAAQIAAGRYYNYVLTATPVAGTPQAKDTCKSFTLNQDGTKGIVDPVTPLTAAETTALIQKCW